MHPAERPHWILNCSETVFVLARDRVYALQRVQQTLAARSSSADPNLTMKDVQHHQAVHDSLGHSNAPQGSLSMDTPREQFAADSSEISSGHVGAPGANRCPQHAHSAARPQLPNNLSVHCVLEESPKWNALSEVLAEISAGRRQGVRGNCLIVVEDERTGAMIRDLIIHGSRSLLEAKFVQWVSRRRRSQVTTGALVSARQHEAKLLRAAADKLSLRHAQRPVSASASSNVAISELIGEKRSIVSSTTGGPATEATHKRAKGSGPQSKIKFPQGSHCGSLLAHSEFFEAPHNADSQSRPQISPEASQDVCERITSHFELLTDPADLFHICSHEAVANEVLDDVQPRYIVLYDAHPAFIRAIELAQSKRPRRKLKVYLVLQEDSVEEQRYRSTLHSEHEAFQALILEKGRMVIPVECRQKNGDRACEARDAQTSRLGPSVNTRLGGSRLPPIDDATPTVVVDMREFRSALPNMLHLHGMDIQPVTLEVGDYVLSPDICIERKAIQDLVQSLNSGRLFNQAEAMLRYYKRPMLLIECEDSRPFGLVNPSDIGPEISSQSVTSKLSLALLHFPKLRILWSRSPSHTVSIFAALKKGQAEPNASFAATVGMPTSIGTEQVFNMAPQDLLRQLPGVYAHNCRKLMNAVSNLEELANKTCAELCSLIGKQNGEQLHMFLHRVV